MGINEKAWGIGFKRMIGDPSLGDGETYGICVDETVRQIHICDIGDAGTDWARSVSSHPELCIHSATTPETYYIKMYSAGATAYIDAVGATTLQLLVAGTAEISIAGSSISPTTSDGAALGTTSLMWSDLFLASGGVINFNASEITMTHSTIGSGGKIKVETEWATASATGRPFEVYLTIADATRLGSYVNAMKAMVDCEESGGVGAGTIGLLSAMNCEMGMPNGACWGNYFCVEMEYVDQASTAFGAQGSGSGAGFMYMAATGTVTDFDSDGVLFSLNGLTANTGKLLGAGSSTLRIDLDQGTLRYIPLSTAGDSYTSAYPISVSDGKFVTASWGGVMATAWHMYLNSNYNCYIGSSASNVLILGTSAGTIEFRCGAHGAAVTINNDGLTTQYLLRVTGTLDFGASHTGVLKVPQRTGPITVGEEGILYYNTDLSKLQFVTVSGTTVETISSS